MGCEVIVFWKTNIGNNRKYNLWFFMMKQFSWWNIIYLNNCYSIMQSRNVKINKFLLFPKLSLKKHTHRLCQNTKFPQSEIFDTIGKLSELSGSPNLIQKWWTFMSWEPNGRPFCSLKYRTFTCWAKLLKLRPHLDLIISYRKNFFCSKQILSQIGEKRINKN